MFFHSLLSSLRYFSFYHLPFFKEVSNKKVCHKSVKTLSTYFHIFIVFLILTCDFTSYTQSSIHFF